MFRGLSTGKFLALYEVFGTGPLMPDTLATFRTLLDKPFPRHWRAKLPQQQSTLPGQPPAVQIATLTIQVCLTSTSASRGCSCMLAAFEVQIRHSRLEAHCCIAALPGKTNRSHSCTTDGGGDEGMCCPLSRRRLAGSEARAAGCAPPGGASDAMRMESGVAARASAGSGASLPPLATL